MTRNSLGSGIILEFLFGLGIDKLVGIVDPFAFVFASFPRAVSVERSLDVTLPMGISVTFTCRYMQIG